VKPYFKGEGIVATTQEVNDRLRQLNDDELVAKLRLRSNDELREFRDKCRRIGTPQAWACRFAIIKVLYERKQAETHIQGEGS
jgi:hypothetical protein